MNPRIVETIIDLISNDFNADFMLKSANTQKYPKADIFESNSHFKIKCEIPYLSKDEISVKIEDSILIVSGKKREEVEEEGFKIVLKEIKKSSFVRKWIIPDFLNLKTITSTFENGFLNILIEKNIHDDQKNFNIEIK